MNLKEKIRQDLNSFLKEKKELEVSVLRLLIAAILNKEKDKRYQLKEGQDISLTDEEVIKVIISEAKKRKEAILNFEKGKRKDLAEKEKKELMVLQRYLPEQISEQEIKSLAQEVIRKLGVKDIKDMGKVMAELMSKIRNRADGSVISNIVRQLFKKENEN